MLLKKKTRGHKPKVYVDPNR